MQGWANLIGFHQRQQRPGTDPAAGPQKYGAPWHGDGEESSSPCHFGDISPSTHQNLPHAAAGTHPTGAGVPGTGAAAAPCAAAASKFYSCLLSRQKAGGGSNKLSTRTRNLMVEMVKRGMGFGDNRCHTVADVNPYGWVWPFTPRGSSPLFPADSGISGNEKDKEQTSWSCDSPEH